MHGNSSPGQTLHIRHFSAFVDARFVVNIALQDGKNPGGGVVTGLACADGRPGNLNSIAINVGHLVINANDDQQGAAGRSLRVPLVLARLELGLHAWHAGAAHV